MEDDDFPEIPDFVPEEFLSEAIEAWDNDGFSGLTPEQLKASEDFARRFLRDDASIAEFMSLLGYVASLTSEDRARLRENLNAMVNELYIQDETIEKTEIPSDLLFIGSNGSHVVKGLHYSREVLGSDGPVILPSSSSMVIVGAYSDEFIAQATDEIQAQYDSYEEQSEAWERQMESYALAIARKYEENPPARLDDFLRDIE